MTKTGWRQTDIREFLCKHIWDRNINAYFIDSHNGFSMVRVGYKCNSCGMIITSLGVDTGHGSVS